MNKFIIPIISLVFLIASCGNNGEESTEKLGGHIITGEVTGADGQNAVLVVFEDQKERVLDTVVVADGKFQFETDTRELREYILLVGENEMPVILFLDESSEDVTVKGALPGIGENYTVSGSDESQYIKDYLVFLKPFFQVEQGIYLELNQTIPDDTVTIKKLIGQLDSVSLIQRDYALKQIEAHPNSATNWIMLRELIPASGLIAFDESDLSYFTKVENGIREKYPYSEYPDMIQSDVEGIKAQIEEMKNPTKIAEGPSFEYAPEITLNDANGKELALSSLRGKTVLIDFWASWCGPCRKENPNVVRVYNEYKDKGFEIYSISLDEDRDAWLEAIAADNLSWPNHVSDLNGWQNAAAVAYGVNAIPATFLIDGEGKVIGTNLRGPQLEQKLKEVLG